jgi:ABC-type branched-subunit amino acid transport system substrate-binding protein
MNRLLVVLAAACCVGAALGAFGLAASAAARTTRHGSGSQVVIPRGQPIELAVAFDNTGLIAPYSQSINDAVQMAIDQQGSIRGFRLQVNPFEAVCGGGTPASNAANAASATAVAGNPQIVAVLGHFCSAEAPTWLPIYQSAGIVAINGSTTAPGLSAYGPTVFDRTAVIEPDFTNTWYPTVKTLPSDIQWRNRFQARFGFPPSDFADLFYDATGVLLQAIKRTAFVSHGNLVINRAALAAAVRRTHNYHGITCTVSLDPATGDRIEDTASLARCARVVVPRGRPVQIAVALDDTDLGASFGPSATQAIQMAVTQHPRIDGFAIHLNLFPAPCDGGTAASNATNAATANAVVANPQNVAVIGHPCSPEAPAWTTVYQNANVVTINGSTTGSNVPPLGPTVFNAMTIPDPEFSDTWYPSVKLLPSDIAWRALFQARFGAPPSDYADLYYDATNVLLAALRSTATVDKHNIVIDRTALAGAVRNTQNFPGVTCTITLDQTTGFRVNDAAALAACAA